MKEHGTVRILDTHGVVVPVNDLMVEALHAGGASKQKKTDLKVSTQKRREEMKKRRREAMIIRDGAKRARVQ